MSTIEDAVDFSSRLQSAKRTSLKIIAIAAAIAVAYFTICYLAHLKCSAGAPFVSANAVPFPAGAGTVTSNGLTYPDSFAGYGETHCLHCYKKMIANPKSSSCQCKFCLWFSPIDKQTQWEDWPGPYDGGKRSTSASIADPIAAPQGTTGG